MTTFITTANGSESYKFLATLPSIGPRCDYRFRTADGRLFTCIAPTVHEARRQRDEWLAGGVKLASHYKTDRFLDIKDAIERAHEALGCEPDSLQQTEAMFGEAQTAMRTALDEIIRMEREVAIVAERLAMLPETIDKAEVFDTVANVLAAIDASNG